MVVVVVVVVVVGFLVTQATLRQSEKQKQRANINLKQIKLK
jgi:hypothetical protein